MEGFHITDYTAYITAATATALLLPLLYKLVVKPVFQRVHEYNTAIQRINTIFEEITPNGGKSIKDSINRIERELSLARERFRALYADYDNAVFETDLEGNCTWVNRTYTRLSQRSIQELLGKGWVNAIYSEDRERVMDSWYKAVRDNREYSEDMRFETPTGKVFSVHCNSYKMLEEHTGDTLGYLGIITEIKD